MATSSSNSTKVTGIPGYSGFYNLSKNSNQYTVQAQDRQLLSNYEGSVNSGQPVNVVTSDANGTLTTRSFNPNDITVTKRDIEFANIQNQLQDRTNLFWNSTSQEWYEITPGAANGNLTLITESQARASLQQRGLDPELMGDIKRNYDTWTSGIKYDTSESYLNSTVNDPSLLPGEPVPGSALRINPPGSTLRSRAITITDQPPGEPSAPAQSFPVAPQGTVSKESTPEVSPLFDQPDVPIGITNPELIGNLAPVTTAIPRLISTSSPAPITSGSSPEFDALTAASTQEIQRTADITSAARGLNITSGVTVARNSDTPSATPMVTSQDWRLRISLASSANYLYGIAQKGDLLYPLRATSGVIFPYTPTIDITYSANYETTTLTHSNYKAYNYTGSSIDNIQISGDFTAQDTVEANYLLAVIHFFRSVTKMFYGRDQNPIAGTPPPLCYLTGFGTYAFDNHPVAVQTFSLKYPNDVDYINAGPNMGGTSGLFANNTNTRLRAAKLQPGGMPPPAVFNQGAQSKINTRVPTKLNIMLTCIPIITRYNMSNTFNLKDYATGKLLKGKENPRGGGIW